MIPSDNIGKSASHPGVFRDGHILSILKSQEQFPSLDLSWCPPCGKVDRTEVDMRLGDLLIEAKLTESDFQRARKPTMGLYRNFREVLSYEELPHNTHAYLSYQLLRNVLVAYATHCAFCVLYGCEEASAN
jgi:hypothetical protein